MATITDYTSLLSNVSDYLGDTLKVNSYPTFVQQFESHVNRTVQVQQQETVVTLLSVSGSTTLPTDYMTWRCVLWTGQTPLIDLDYVHPAYLRTTHLETDGGNPSVFTIEGTILKVKPVNDVGSVQLHYFATVPALTALAPTNWLILDSPDAYLFGVLTEAAAFGEFTEAAVMWKARRDAALQELQDAYSVQLGTTSDTVRMDSYF